MRIDSGIPMVRVACSTMRSLVPHDRPRERLDRLGVDALGD
jgi:hypothetical protein